MHKQSAIYNTMGYYSALKRNEILICYNMGKTWKKHSKWNSSHTKEWIHDSIYIRNLDYRQIHWSQSRTKFSEYGERENGELFNGHRVSVGDDEKFWK